MLFNHFATTVLATFALLCAPVLGSAIPAEVTELDTLEFDGDFHTMAADVEIKFWDSTKCRTSYGGRRGYNSGSCINLDKKYTGVSLQARRNLCHLIRYTNNNCKNRMGSVKELDKCYNVGEGVNSFKVVC